MNIKGARDDIEPSMKGYSENKKTFDSTQKKSNIKLFVGKLINHYTIVALFWILGWFAKKDIALSSTLE